VCVVSLVLDRFEAIPEIETCVFDIHAEEC
jgi:hypothetical protein